MTEAPKGLSSSLQSLALNPTSSKKAPTNLPPDSWEDESSSSEPETARPHTPQQAADFPSAPPPTPISASNSQSHSRPFISPYDFGTDGPGDSSAAAGGARRERDADRRPEKTDAVAKRLIAGALGVRAPKKTDEQRAYDKAIKEKEIKRRNREKEELERARVEAERARVAVWED